MRVNTIDPSGNYEEGHGTTGIGYFEDSKLYAFCDVAAKDFLQVELYWKEVADRLLGGDPQTIVCESFRLQKAKAGVQIGSWLETPQMIGYLRMRCFARNIKWVYQNPQDKVRVSDAILEHLGVLTRKVNRYYALGTMTNDHIRDAIRHGEFYFRYGKGKTL